MNKNIKIGLLLICISLSMAVFVTTAPEISDFIKGFCLSLGVVLSIKGGIQHRVSNK